MTCNSRDLIWRSVSDRQCQLSLAGANRPTASDGKEPIVAVGRKSANDPLPISRGAGSGH